MGCAGSTEARAQNATNAAIEAEIARVRALPTEQQVAIGKKYIDPEELWLALEAGGGGSTLILRASWFMEQRGGRLPKRGDTLPPEATISVAELRQIAKASACKHGALPVIALSHFWRTKKHPDPDGETLELIITSLEQRWPEYARKGVSDLGIIVDYCALHQAPRTPEQDVAFKAGLTGINQWYAHQGTTVWLVTAGVDRVKGLRYWDKGWTSFEFALALLIKPANSSTMKDWAQVVDLGKEGKAQTEFDHPALLEPLTFFGGHVYGNKTYTNGADRDAIVAPKFRDTMFEVMGGVDTLNFGKLKWGDAEAKALAVVLPLCGNLTKLQLTSNNVGDAGMVALAGAMGSMAQLRELELYYNKIGDAGVAALANACVGGALGSVTELRLYSNRIGDQGMIAFSDALASGALRNCQTLHLGGNRIGDAGVTALAEAYATGALALGANIYLMNNHLTDAGKQAARDATSGCGRKVYL